ncbi:hypothetical protein EVAR_61158_1 [Eumeta japonica]|uniref:Uncharacterized protein n=1 Tax=Eumeta variegata TaxID=151549 RepID=A0A4C2A9A9_EUMVA|nr:hypothetical protein EVAR_61158_1 [Eumeta japonica]
MGTPPKVSIGKGRGASPLPQTCAKPLECHPVLEVSPALYTRLHKTGYVSHVSRPQSCSTPKCINCTRAGCEDVAHSALSQECGVRAKWDAIARTKVAYC